MNLEQVKERAQKIGYQLPEVQGVDSLYLVGTSGGADSSATAIILKTLFPAVPFTFIFADTGVEDPSVLQTIEQLEDWLDITVTRLPVAKDLFGLIEGFGGLLPSRQRKFCTRILKIEPLKKYMAELSKEGYQIHSIAGLRADEKARKGVSNTIALPHFPLRELGITQADVFSILEETIGVPQLYRNRTRSGCVVCYEMRQSELMATLRWNKQGYHRAAAYEKLSQADLKRFSPHVSSVSKEARIGLNHCTLPIPARVDLRIDEEAAPVKWPKAKRRTPSPSSLFDTEGSVLIWVGAEFFVHPGLVFDSCPGVWWQELVCFSYTHSGLTTQMKNHYKHRLRVPDVYDLSVEEMREQLRFATYLVEIPASLVSTEKPETGSYTWKPDMAMLQLEQINAAIVRTLNVSQMDQEIDDLKNALPCSWEEERREAIMESRARIKKPFGKVLVMDRLTVGLDDKEEPETITESFNSVAA